MTVRALIVDDEEPARSELRFLLARHPEVEVAGEASGVAEALAMVGSLQPAAVILDVEMPGSTGLDAAAALRETRPSPAVVFVTAHARYALEAFAVEAFDYLLKPVAPDRLARIVERLRGHTVETGTAARKIAVVAAGRTELVDFDQIHFVQADGDYCRVHTFDRAYLATLSLAEVERRLPSGTFARVHRSHLVNLSKVVAVRRPGPDRLSLQLGDRARTELDVARRQSRQVRERLRL